MESKYKQQRSLWWYLLFISIFFFCALHFSLPVSQRKDLTQPLQHYSLSTLQRVNCVLINLKGARRRGVSLFGLTSVVLGGRPLCLTRRPWTQQQYRYLIGCHREDNECLMIFFYGGRKKKKKGLTALVTLDHDILDGQQAALPWGYGFKHDLRKREETHNTDDKWAHVFEWHFERGCPCAWWSLARANMTCSWLGGSWPRGCRPMTLFLQYITVDRCCDVKVLN